MTIHQEQAPGAWHQRSLVEQLADVAARSDVSEMASAEPRLSEEHLFVRSNFST